MYKLKVVRTFAAAHFLNGYKGPCATVHGHTWKVVFTFSFPNTNKGKLNSDKNLPIPGMIYDFKSLKEKVDEILPDHKFLNEICPWNELSPTAENLAEYFYQEIARCEPSISSVEVWESEHACAEYTES